MRARQCRFFTSSAVLALACLTGCGETARLEPSQSMGRSPVLVEPNETLIPTVNIAPAIGWGNGNKPVAAPGTTVVAFADSLDHPRWLYVLPNGDVLVAETAAPPRPSSGIRGFFMKRAMKKAGSAVPSANRITLLRDADGDGIAELRHVFLSGLNSPFGMALVGSDFYVANTDALVRFPYREGDTEIRDRGTRVAELPAGELNRHWTKNVIASKDGGKLYVAVGSNSNVAENGMENEQQRAAILEIDPRTGQTRVFASGLRNPVGLAWHPDDGRLWTVVNERDELGSDLVPDYLASVRDGGFYGWPYSYFGQHVDERVKPPRPDLVARAIVPEYALGAHTASLGLAWSPATSTLPESLRNGMIVGQHGSWNRRPHSGYKVIFVPFHNGEPAGLPVDVLTGFLSDEGEAQGRPVGVVIDGKGALLVADDVGNVIWRVTGTPPDA